ncbi:hypothetical protein EBR96_00775 [bacterium]|nr:hypothetical protein [bacterium]
MCSILFALLKTPNIDRTAFESQFKSALQLAAYRGPDSQTVVQFDKNTFLGHARLRIIDFSDASNQPMINGNRAMLFNGEIYNYKSLDPTATSDTRTLFSLIQTDPHFYRQLVGMYAIISYNKETHEGHVFRDFYGEKPVYYFNNDDLFIVSSTIKSILHLIKTLPAISLTSDLVSELEFLTFGFIREPHTIIPSIKALPPGHCLSFTDDSISVVPLPKTPFPIQADAAAQYMDLTYSAADIPATLLLSAGVDSTVVLSHLLARGRVPNISIYRSPNPATDESQQALVHLDILSKAFGVRIQPQVISNVLAPDTLYEYFINGLEQPTSDGLNLYNLLTGLKQSDPDLRLILTGMGGDELFGGYSSFRHPEFSALIPWIPTAARPLLPNRLKRFLRFKPMPYGNPALNYYFLYRLNDAAAFRIDDAHIARLYQRFLDTVSPFLAEKTTFSEVVKTCETFDNKIAGNPNQEKIRIHIQPRSRRMPTIFLKSSV